MDSIEIRKLERALASAEVKTEEPVASSIQFKALR